MIAPMASPQSVWGYQPRTRKEFEEGILMKNFAGTPGGAEAPPLQTMESILSPMARLAE